MTNITAQDRRVQYAGNNPADAGPFSFSFQVNATSEIKVYVDSTVKTLTTHYTVNLSADGTGTVSFTSGNFPTNTETITIMSNIPISRTSQFTTGGTLTASALETEFNNQFMHHQQHDQRLDRALLVPEHDTISGANFILPAKASRLGKLLGFNSSTGNPEATFSVADGNTLAGISGDIATLADIEDGTDATNAIQTVAGIQANVTTVAGISSNVTTVAGISSDVTTVAGKASLITSDFVSDLALIDSTFVSKMNLVTSDFVSDVNTLATSDIVSDINLLATTDVISDLNTLATSDIVSDLNTLATSDIVSDINTLATSDIVSDLNTLATSDIVSDINTLATSDIVADLALLATSDFVSDLNTMATSSNVSNLNTVAGAVTNVNNVGGSIANVNTVATNISGVNSFAERYRVQSGVPSSNNDIGDLVFDTSANTLKVFGSSGFQNAGSSVNGTSARFSYNISGTPTAVTGADANGNTLAYDAGFVDVYLNGVKMLNGTDVTVTSGDTVTFASALANGDLVDIVAFGTFSVANIVSTGALNSGSITSGFGNIDTGSSTITTTGAISGGALSGTSLDLNGGELILDSDNDTSITSDTDDRVDIKVGGSDKVHITSTGLGIGTTSPSSTLELNSSSSNSARLKVGRSTSHTNYLELGTDGGESTIRATGASSTNGTLIFQRNDGSSTSESMRINQDGGLIVNGTASGGGAITAYNVANAFAPPIVELNNVATDFSSAMFELRVSSGSINTVNGRFIHCYSDNGSTTKMKVLGDGDIENVNNNYTGISDLKLKENIADSNSQWDDLKNLKVKKFSFKADKKDKADKIGVIAQDLEASNMSGLVRESKDFDSEGNDLGTTTKSVKYSILYMKAVKALQEAMARIETLEAKVTALEGK